MKFAVAFVSFPAAFDCRAEIRRRSTLTVRVSVAVRYGTVATLCSVVEADS